MIAYCDVLLVELVDLTCDYGASSDRQQDRLQKRPRTRRALSRLRAAAPGRHEAVNSSVHLSHRKRLLPLVVTPDLVVF